jgi:glycosyltransferase involved in cell wall biosynthesis
VGRGFFDAPAPHPREQYGIPSDHQVVVFMGVLTKLQGVDILMDTIPVVLKERDVPVVLKERDDVTFIVIGFPHEDRFAEELARRGGSDRVVFTGRIDYLSVSRVLAMADLALSPKMSETEGNGKLFNYMACGLPTVVFDNRVNREILGEYGIYVENGTAPEFARKVLEALSGGPRVRELGVRLRERAKERASWEANRPVIQKVYGEARVRTARARAGSPTGGGRK